MSAQDPCVEAEAKPSLFVKLTTEAEMFLRRAEVEQILRDNGWELAYTIDNEHYWRRSWCFDLRTPAGRPELDAAEEWAKMLDTTAAIAVRPQPTPEVTDAVGSVPSPAVQDAGGEGATSVAGHIAAIAEAERDMRARLDAILPRLAAAGYVDAYSKNPDVQVFCRSDAGQFSFIRLPVLSAGLSLEGSLTMIEVAEHVLDGATALSATSTIEPTGAADVLAPLDRATGPGTDGESDGEPCEWLRDALEGAQVDPQSLPPGMDEPPDGQFERVLDRLAPKAGATPAELLASPLVGLIKAGEQPAGWAEMLEELGCEPVPPHPLESRRDALVLRLLAAGFVEEPRPDEPLRRFKATAWPVWVTVIPGGPATEWDPDSAGLLTHAEADCARVEAAKQDRQAAAVEPSAPEKSMRDRHNAVVARLSTMGFRGDTLIQSTSTTLMQYPGGACIPVPTGEGRGAREEEAMRAVEACCDMLEAPKAPTPTLAEVQEQVRALQAQLTAEKASNAKYVCDAALSGLRIVAESGPITGEALRAERAEAKAEIDRLTAALDCERVQANEWLSQLHDARRDLKAITAALRAELAALRALCPPGSIVIPPPDWQAEPQDVTRGNASITMYDAPNGIGWTMVVYDALVEGEADLAGAQAKSWAALAEALGGVVVADHSPDVGNMVG